MSKEKYPLIAVGAIPDSTFYDHFENADGEFEVTIDVTAKTGTLRGSDVGELLIAGDGVCGDLILSEAEFKWLRDAWFKATGGELRDLCCPVVFLQRLGHIVAQGSDGGTRT